MILCPLYSSEEYIGAEFESVEKQTYPNWTLMISNDNSNEATMKILRDFMARDSRVKMMENNSGRRGPHGNYRNLIINTEGAEDYDYFAYMDNDDIWKPFKLEHYVNLAEHIKKVKGQDTPICFSCNMEIIDSEGKLRDPDFASTYEYEIKNPMDAFFTHRVFGCNLFLDRQVYFALREMMKDPDFPETISFDNFTYQTAAALGADLSFVPNVLMSYRRHFTNTTKEAVYTIDAKYFMRALKELKQVIHNNAFIARDSMDAIDYMLKLDQISPAKKKELREIREALEEGGVKAMKVWNKYHINCGNRLRTAENWLSLCLGLERKYMDREKYPEL